jgi:hypothetical protein
MKKLLLTSLFLPAVIFATIRQSPGGPVRASDGSQRDVAVKLAQARPGETVSVPAGTFQWNGIILPRGVALKGMKGGTYVKFTNGTPYAACVTTSDNSELSGINFTDYSPAAAGWRSGNFVLVRSFSLIHDCVFDENHLGNVGKEMLVQVNGSVIYNCIFTTYPGDTTTEGFNSKWNARDNHVSSEWLDNNYLGTKDLDGKRNTYFEDCKFYNFAPAAATDVDDNSRVVVRHCTFDNTGMGTHGLDTSPWGLRHLEVGHCTFTYHGWPRVVDAVGGRSAWPNLPQWLLQRGAVVLVHDCKFDLIQSQDWGTHTAMGLEVQSLQRSDSIPCQTNHPAWRQIGVDHDKARNKDYTLGDWFWNNTGPGWGVQLFDYSPDDCGNGQKIAEYVKDGRDYFDGTKPSWFTEYTYPHPLRK